MMLMADGLALDVFVFAVVEVHGIVHACMLSSCFLKGALDYELGLQSDCR